MIFLPAIDIRDGKAVRLEQGRFEKETVYADDPLEAARSWVEAGARSLHVVDLDGAREGEPQNLEHLKRITAELRVPTVGIGAGPDCDAQVLVWQDMAGLRGGRMPKFVKQYADLRSVLSEAVGQFADEVREGSFPTTEQSYS